MGLIGISGKIGSGKDLCGKIIQYLTSIHGKEETRTFEESALKIDKDGFGYSDYHRYNSDWKIKKRADKLKDIVCLLIGCTRAQLEDIDFKNKPLGEEWIRYSYATGFTKDNNGNTTMLSTQCSKEKYEEEVRTNWQTAYKTEFTPRLLLQYIGTELFRDKLHENVHINATFSDYKSKYHDYPMEPTGLLIIDSEQGDKFIKYDNFPNWIITDIRFPNEAKAIKDRKGILIRTNRQTLNLNNINNFEHPSETALDDYDQFDYIIENNGTIEELIEKVKEILIKEKLI